MRTNTITILMVTLVVALAASASWAGTWDGTVKLGGIMLDEEGDFSTVQETYNIHDGFSVTQIRLDGMLDPRNYFMLNLREVNLDGRQGDFVYRRPGTFKLTAGFDQHRQVFDAERAVNSERKDWKAGAQYTPAKWMTLSGYFNYLMRDGDRLRHPAGSTGVLGATTTPLGTSYDNALVTGQVNAEVRQDRRGAALSYRVSDYSDQLNAASDRTGQVVSTRLYTPCFFYDKWTHLVRGAYGVRKLSNDDIDYTLTNVQYTGIVRPIDAFQFKYNFDANRIDSQSTGFKTDRFQNNVDASYFYKYGRVSGGYGYETNDDDRRLTSYRSWRAGTAFRYKNYLNAKFDYAGRVKKDDEELTLVKDVEASQIRARLEVKPIDDVVVGGGYARREREFPDIDVKTTGDMVNAFGRYSYAGWGALSGDYTFSTDEYVDLYDGFDAESHVVTGRVECERIKNLWLASGVTYIDIGKDLDIEKSMVFVEGIYTVLDDYHLEVKYNVYNYDDYILLDRYYTANVVWINVAYDLHFE